LQTICRRKTRIRGLDKKNMKLAIGNPALNEKHVAGCRALS